ncbi:GNAT family N-acetyltransferase [Pseudonocardia sp. KRD291]|uniref:GNAT family N-acetyltransferase n=1 Tax=Pseudonocardia sp. KRD291 TaxID=2792007 RepID=UPI001C4A3D28|nr:GNAT family N-acetyltransferase [Pseudonocardia sp. KRD291]MBW0104491.1 GNAT family N-acetyltransferase [Pseudonocardia sp. KRD291]
MPAVPTLRPARPADLPAIEELMAASVRAHFPSHYDVRQTASAARHIARPDAVLVDDGTYYVHEAGGRIVACGGWSMRAKLFAGPSDDPDDDPLRRIDPATEPARIRAMFVDDGWTRRGLGREIVETSARAASGAGFAALVLVATLPGVALYESCGFLARRSVRIVHPDGVELDGLLMDRDAARAG